MVAFWGENASRIFTIAVKINELCKGFSAARQVQFVNGILMNMYPKHRATKWGYSFGIQERITHISSTFCWRNLDFLPEFRILQKCTAFHWTFIMRWHENANWYVPFRFYAFQSYKFQAILAESVAPLPCLTNFMTLSGTNKVGRRFQIYSDISSFSTSVGQLH